jgi:hypothetical protein
MEKKIEFEEVTLKIPKPIMEFLRNTPSLYGPAIDFLEYIIVDEIRANIEATSGEEIIESQGLGPVFRELLKDERFGGS